MHESKAADNSQVQAALMPCWRAGSPEIQAGLCFKLAPHLPLSPAIRYAAGERGGKVPLCGRLYQF